MKRASAQAIVSLCNAKRAIVAADESAFDCHGSVAKRKATTHCTWGIERDGLGGVRVLSVDRVTDARRGNGEDADDTRTDAEKEQDMNDLLVLFHMLKTDRVLAHVFVVMALASKERCRSSTPQTSSFMTNYCARRIASAPSFRLLHFVLTNMTSIAANEELVARFPVIINVCSVMHRYFSCGVASCQQRNDFDFFLKESGDTDVACTVQIAESPTQPGQRRKIRSTSDHRRETQPKKEGREAFKVKGPSIASKPTTARIVICADESAFDAFGRDGS